MYNFVSFVVDNSGVSTLGDAKHQCMIVKEYPKFYAYGVLKPASISIHIKSIQEYYELLLAGKIDELLRAYYIFYSCRPTLTFCYV